MKINITRRRNARHVIARRTTDGCYHVTVPAHMKTSTAELIIADLIKHLEASCPDVWKQKFYENQQISGLGIPIRILRQKIKPDKVIGFIKKPCFIVGVGNNLEWGKRETDLAINRVVLANGRAVARQQLITDAEKIAKAAGIRPAEWTIGRGHRTLGTCHPDGRITLSYLLVFLPQPLREYVICHELAHLSEMNHSDSFHEICDRYCAGHEKELAAMLRKYDWPIIR